MVIEDDFSGMDHIQRELDRLNDYAIEVGFFGGTEEENFYAMIANVHEYGMTIHAKKKYLTIPTKHAQGRKASEIEGLFRPPGTDILAVANNDGTLTVMFILKESVKIPERSFLRSTFDGNETKWVDFFEKQVDKMIDGEITAKLAFERLGAKIVADIQKKMTDIKSPKNAKITEENKNSDNPLVNTRELIRRVTWRVVSSN